MGRGRGNYTRSKVGEAGLGVIDIDRPDGECKRLRGRRITARIRVVVTSGNHDGQARIDSSSSGIIERLIPGGCQRHVCNLLR